MKIFNMNYLQLLVLICSIHFCICNKLLQDIIDNFLLKRNIKFVTYIYDKHVDMAFTRKGYARINYQNYMNKSKIINKCHLNSFAYIVLLDSDISKQILSQLDLEKYITLIITNNFNRTLTQLHEKVNLQWNSDIIVISKNILDRESYECWKVFGSSKKTTVHFNMTYIGTWSSIYDMTIDNIYRERRSMEGISLKISSVMVNSNRIGTLNEEYAFLKAERELCYIFLNFLKYIHKFQIEVIHGKNSAKFGNEVDILSDFMEEHAVENQDFISQIYPFRKTFILKNPVGGNRNIFIKPFSPLVWYLLIVLLLLMILVLKLLLDILERFGMVNDKSWSLVILILLSTFCLEGSPVDYDFISWRVFLFTSMLTSVLLYNYYSSIMVSLLLINPLPNIKSVADLHKTNIKLAREDQIPDYYEVENVTFNSNDYNSAIYNLTEAITEIKSGEFAYYTEPATRYKLIETHLSFLEVCSLIEIDAVATAYTAIMVPKNSEFKEIFRISVRRLVERGFLKRELSRLLKRKPTCFAHVDFSGLSLNDLSAALGIFFCGVVLSIMIFFLELLHFKFSYLYRKKSQ